MRLSGELAQLARASALQAEGQGFEPPILHLKTSVRAFRAGAGGARDLVQSEGRVQESPLGRVHGAGAAALPRSLTERRA